MAAPVPEVFEHNDPWTEAEFLDLPVDRRVVTDVVLVVEITSLGNAAVERAVKPQLYAQAGVPHYLRIELDETGPRALVHRLDRGHYVEVTCADAGCPLILTEPIAVTLDLAALAASTRPT